MKGGLEHPPFLWWKCSIKKHEFGGMGARITQCNKFTKENVENFIRMNL